LRLLGQDYWFSNRLAISDTFVRTVLHKIRNEELPFTIRVTISRSPFKGSFPIWINLCAGEWTWFKDVKPSETQCNGMYSITALWIQSLFSEVENRSSNLFRLYVKVEDCH
jgi:hypothetical protein